MAREIDFIGVPPPLYKYSDDGYNIHPDNQAILTSQPHLKLDKETLTSYRKHRARLSSRIKAFNVESLIEQYNQQRQRVNTLRIQYTEIKEYISEIIAAIRGADLDPKTDVIARLVALRLYNTYCQMKPQIKRAIADLKATEKKLDPFRDDYVLLRKLERKLESHYAAIDDERQEEILRQGMAQEAFKVCGQIQSTLARLGLCHRYTKGNKTFTDYVEFERVIATPDTLQIKILASEAGLFGGAVDKLPSGVYISDIINNKVMDDLTATIEREVWSPHLQDNIPFVNGAWIIVERLGLVGGLPRKISYRALMARYDTAEHNRIPIPAGIKKGRRVNWININSPVGYHLMFDGITGSGKSNAIRAMISCIIETQSPRDVVFAFIDLKNMGDFKDFENVPHTLGIDGYDSKVMYEIQHVVDMLQHVRSEMLWRKKQINQIAYDIDTYNKAVEPSRQLPRIIIIFDEYANTRRRRFSEEADIIDDICIEITQQGRAAGIHLWIGTQQPRADNMPPALRDNLLTKFHGKQANVGAAQSVSGNRSTLAIQDIPGRMLCEAGANHYPVQMPHITTDDIKKAITIATQNYGDLKPYALVTPSDETPDVISDEDIVLQIVMEQFGRQLKARQLYEEFLRGQMTIRNVESAVKNLSNSETVSYNGVDYEPVKQQGNWYLLVEKENES